MLNICFQEDFSADKVDQRSDSPHLVKLTDGTLAPLHTNVYGKKPGILGKATPCNNGASFSVAESMANDQLLQHTKVRLGGAAQEQTVGGRSVMGAEM